MTSAKLNRGVEELFLEITKKMVEKAEEDAKKNDTVPRSSSRRNIVTVVDDDAQQAGSGRGRGCCGSSRA